MYKCVQRVIIMYCCSDSLSSPVFVGRPYMRNYLPILRRSALLFMTHSYWGGVSRWAHLSVCYVSQQARRELCAY